MTEGEKLGVEVEILCIHGPSRIRRRELLLIECIFSTLLIKKHPLIESVYNWLCSEMRVLSRDGISVDALVCVQVNKHTRSL